MASIINALTSGGGVAISGDTSGNLAIQSAGTNIATFNTSGNMVFGVSNAGINFNNSSAVGASTLNDYETGTWTPTATPNSGGTITSYTSFGTYTKVGRMVNLTFKIILTNPGTASGSLAWGGAPFLSGTTNQQSPLIVREGAATGYIYQAWVDSGATGGTIQSTTGGSISWTTGYSYYCNVTYPAAS
ncbi:hypothetical protein [Bacteriophage sp.]|nr:hypothetical protein [Bacteriophage sp.]